MRFPLLIEVQGVRLLGEVTVALRPHRRSEATEKLIYHVLMNI